MPESPQVPDKERSVATGRRVRWDALAAIIASLVGLLALAVGGYTAYIQRQQVRAEVWPYLMTANSNALGQFELVVANKGVGPAIVHSVQVLVDGKPVADWDELYGAIDFKPTSDKVITSSLASRVLSPGDTVHWIAFQNQEDIDAFWRDWKRSHVEARICYSSTLGDSWRVVYGPGNSRRPEAVPGCPSVPQSETFHE